MSTDVSVEPIGPVVKMRRGPRREVIYRHTLLVRLSHGINALVVFLMIGSGPEHLQRPSPALLGLGRRRGRSGPRLDRCAAGSRRAACAASPISGAKTFDTTGVLGASMSHGHMAAMGWPSWIILPGFQDLADARHWHLFFAWVLITNGALYIAWSLLIRHVQRDLWPTWADLGSIPRSAWAHLRNRHPHGRGGQALQRAAEAGLSGPDRPGAGHGGHGPDHVAGHGRRRALACWTCSAGASRRARCTSFFAGAIVLFIIVHVAEVFLAGPVNEIRSILTGNYHVPPDRPAKGRS